MRWIVAFITLVLLATVAAAQTETPTPTPTPTDTPAPVVQFTLPAPESTPGQAAAFEYTATVGELHIANLLTALLFSVWGMFLFVVIFPRGGRK